MKISIYKIKIKPFRFYLYHKHIINYDYMDKQIQLKHFLLPCIDSIIIQSEFLLFSKPHILFATTYLEIIGQQRFFLQTFLKETYFRNCYLKLTLRKLKLLIFLEICFNSIFLNYPFKKNLNYNQLNAKLHIFLESNTINNLNLFRNNCSIQISLPYSKIIKNYYLIPN